MIYMQEQITKSTANIFPNLFSLTNSTNRYQNQKPLTNYILRAKHSYDRKSDYILRKSDYILRKSDYILRKSDYILKKSDYILRAKSDYNLRAKQSFDRKSVSYDHKSATLPSNHGELSFLSSQKIKGVSSIVLLLTIIISSTINYERVPIHETVPIQLGQQVVRRPAQCDAMKVVKGENVTKFKLQCLINWKILQSINCNI